MTETLERITSRTEELFQDDRLVTSEPPNGDWDRRLEACRQGNLTKQQNALCFQQRVWQAQQMGFTEMTEQDIYQSLTGKPYKHRQLTDDFYRLEYGVQFNNPSKIHRDWSIRKVRYTSAGFRFLFHVFGGQDEVVSGAMDYLKKPIPYGVMLRVEEVKKLGIFNHFRAFAPADAWKDAERVIDPIIVGSMCDDDEVPGTLAESRLFFIAKW